MARRKTITAGELGQRWGVTARLVRNWWHAQLIPPPIDGTAAILKWRMADVLLFERSVGLKLESQKVK